MRTWLGFRDDSDADLIVQLNQAQAVLEDDPRFEEVWFLLQIQQPLAFTGGNPRVNLPDDYLRDYDDGGLWVYDSTADPMWTLLDRDTYGFLQAAHGGETTTTWPEHYAVVGLEVHVWPTPSSDKTLYYDYYARAVEIVAGAENVWMKHAHQLIVGEAGYTYAAALKNSSAMAYFEQMRNAGAAKLIRQIGARAMAGRTLSIGGPDA